jgi:hypothetical protein
MVIHEALSTAAHKRPVCIQLQFRLPLFIVYPNDSRAVSQYTIDGISIGQVAVTPQI